MIGLFVSLFLWTLLLYGPPALAARAIEYAIMRRAVAQPPALRPFVRMHVGVILLVAAVTAPLCYVFTGSVLRAAMDLRDIGGGIGMTASFLISLALPLQLHYTVNRTLCEKDAEGRIKNAWLPLLWGGATVFAVILAWLPLWTGVFPMPLSER